MDARPAVLQIESGTVWASAGGTGDTPPPTLVDAALDWIDDPVGLLDERPVAVADLWRSLVVTLLGPRCEAVVLVHPPDWPRHRVDRVVAAVNTVADHIEAVRADRWSGVPDGVPDGDADELRLPAGGRRRRTVVLLAGVAVTGAVAAGWFAVDPTPPSPGVRTVVEGRMAVRIPPGWRVQRVTDGPGSRRLEAGPPGDPALVVHLTAAYAPGTTLAQAAEALARAMAQEPPGVFADFRADAVVAGRQAVTYRENRPGRIITWAVVLAGSTRIGIGCQSVPGRESDVRTACEDAVRSAREA